jgi:sulfoxide reductase heme-binding subunit YedZ
VTSTRNAQKRMGFRSWQRLHRLSYVVGVLAIIHFVWRENKDIREPLVYGGLLALLLGARLVRERRPRARRRAQPEEA